MTLKKNTRSKKNSKKGVVIPINKVAPRAENEKAFWVNFGPILHSLEELATTLRNMNEETFRYHVTKDRNDFARWVEEVMNEKTLAQKLQKCDSKTCCANAVGKHIRVYY